MSENTKQKRNAKISKSKTGVPRADRGELNANWKGNKSERHTAMERLEYKIWRATVFKRDDFTCILCLERATKLEAHHIVGWAAAPDLRYDVSNGITLCKLCHEKMTKREHEFQDRFTAYVLQAIPVILTDEERKKFEPIYVVCSYCGKDKRTSAWHLKKRWHFCDRACKQGYEKAIGGNWRMHAKS